MKTPNAPVKTTLVPALARGLGRQLLDQLYPPVCLHCEAPVVEANGLCPSCWRTLHLITPPLCPVLGLPFEVELGPDARSAEAIADPPPFARARSAVVYTEIARKLVGRLKYADQPEVARFCASLMRVAGAELLEDDPVLVPVPLHRFRLWQRRYNQSMELARQLSHLTGLEAAPQLVTRKKRTRQQVGLSADQRRRNVSGAFGVRDDALSRLKGRRVVLIDDVITTGATVRALTRALNRAGIGEIDVLSFARVVVGGQTPI